MRKRLFLYLGFGMLSGLGLVYGTSYRQKLLFYAARYAAENAFVKSCKEDFDCKWALKPAASQCAELSTDPKKVGNRWIDQEALIRCLQKNFYSHSCKDEKRCLATIDNHFDKCHRIAYPSDTKPDDPAAATALGTCLQERSTLGE